MPIYNAPLRDIRFVLREFLDPAENASLPGHGEATAETIDAVLEEAARFCAAELQPLNATGDAESCHFENGTVRTPTGFRAAYEKFASGGWAGLSCDPAYGGQGLPLLLETAIQEMISSANLSFGMYPGLSAGAYRALYLHGTETQKTLYLPHLVSGRWSGTMCLTEPQCGTDLGLIKTHAVPDAAGSYRLSGTKIFISAGEHDLTENIVHLVLGRLVDAPQGVQGLSLFVCPKFLPNPDGSLGARNTLACGGIEQKMGIKASATCVMNFDGATAWLVGAPHKGMQAMFTMMNAARLAVGMQGLGIAEMAYQGAAAYARERLQMRALSGTKFPEKPADPIIVHPDVRRMLLTVKSLNEGCRALSYWVSHAADVAAKDRDPARRAQASDFVALMTPIVKAFLTDHGFNAANLGLQIFGGHGYIRDWGMEQLVRDARITQIYEGTNGIQALDLVGRKLPLGTGRLLGSFFHPVSAYIESKAADPALTEFREPLAKSFARLQRATAWLAGASMKDPDEAGAAASDYLRLFALTALAYVWCRMVEIALAKQKAAPETPEDARFYRAKIACARFFMARLLPETSGLFAAIMSGAAPLMSLESEAF